ncbi:MAG: DNA-deoxyinosine glycosylase [Chitinophagaceae bacterium]|nr:DNA-deoxyinosine glycosylase [Chitinophagaceae bacterium]
MKKAFAPLVNNKSKIIILGTMPGEKSLKLQQYYGHSSNHFWKIIFALFEKKWSADYDQRKQLILENNLALWDVLAYCERSGSADNNINNETANDFEKFYKQYPQIKNVFFASRQAEKYYDTLVIRKPGRIYYTLPSPSSANAWKTLDEKIKDWKIIIRILNNN